MIGEPPQTRAYFAFSLPVRGNSPPVAPSASSGQRVQTNRSLATGRTPPPLAQ